MRKKHKALWNFAVEPKTGHGPGQKTWPLVFSFLRHTFAARVPADADPREGPVTLNALSPESGYLGQNWDVAKGGYQDLPIAPYADFTGDKSTASWLVNAAYAADWQAFQRDGQVADRENSSPEAGYITDAFMRSPYLFTALLVAVPTVLHAADHLSDRPSLENSDLVYKGRFSWISHVASSGSELAVQGWWRYRYTGDREWLRTHAYPLLRGTVEFYRHLVKKEADGRYHLSGTNAHEDFWGVGDSIMDLAAIRGTVPLAIRAAEILEVDAELRGRWKELLANLAPTPKENR